MIESNCLFFLTQHADHAESGFETEFPFTSAGKPFLQYCDYVFPIRQYFSSLNISSTNPFPYSAGNPRLNSHIRDPNDKYAV